jgi:UDP-N-acetylmuramoyl-L-alanyl-D-glutamate--2,6-diaminopimelate ligase
VSYGLGAGCDVVAEAVHIGRDSIRFTAVGPGLRAEVISPLPGAYNVSNILAALTCATQGLGVDAAEAAQAIAMVEAVPGRMEPIDVGQVFQAVIDFAHTPNALRRALAAARERAQGRVIVVFGCAGLRDASKRPAMAAAAVELADLAVFTAEDPRTEPLSGILEQMAAGAMQAGGEEGKDFQRISDRPEALRWAVRQARAGDLVIATGKGHEQSMAFGEVEYPWDDRIAMRAALAELLGVPGPEMPKLPTQE